MRRWQVGLAVVAVTIGLAACAPDSDPPVDPEDSSEATSAGVGARADVVFGDCGLEVGTQAVTGTVTNSQESAQDYTITVTWVGDGSSVIVRGIAEVALDGGATQGFEVTADVPEAALDCTFNVTREASA